MKSDGIDRYHQILLKIYFTMKSDGIYSIFIYKASGGRRVLPNPSGFGGYFPIPPRHASAIISLYFLNFLRGHAVTICQKRHICEMVEKLFSALQSFSNL